MEEWHGRGCCCHKARLGSGVWHYTSPLSIHFRRPRSSHMTHIPPCLPTTQLSAQSSLPLPSSSPTYPLGLCSMVSDNPTQCQLAHAGSCAECFGINPYESTKVPPSTPYRRVSTTGDNRLKERPEDATKPRNISHS